ncbi:penicillin-binding transpeptidase domain-containing protein [Oryzobacter sp. R7]|uniref:penicillin-binding transpeptidase domain-containing protein n=1 Tax=Oryzobacter faecalis TaxID=3388656 RepID=UPI00398D5DF7
MRGRLRGRIVIAVVAVLVLGGALGGALWWRQREAARDTAATEAVELLARAWAAKDLAGAPLADPALASAFEEAVAPLGEAPVTVRTGSVRRSDAGATSTLTVRWTLPGESVWEYEVPARAVERGERWVVAAPDDARSPWFPGLAADETIEVERTRGARGDLLDRDGRPLMPEGPVFTVLLDPVNATPESAAGLETVVGARKGSLVEALGKATDASSKAPVTAITYREADYTARKARLDALAGVVVREGVQPLAVTRTFGQPLLGGFGDVTAEMVQQGGGRYAAGDRAGTSGLQRQYDEQLGGTTGLVVRSSGGRTLFEKAATDGEDVRTTLAPRVQQAAEKALADARLEAASALVAIDVETGEVLAAANAPSSGFDRALTGRYPPGSTFKVASTYAFLTRGITSPGAKVRCPESAVVDGREFRNFAGESAPGHPTFFEDFTISCNTAFVSLASRLEADDLTTAAKALGIGAGWAEGLGVTGAFEGSVPPTTGGTDAAAAVIGQGRTEVSPLAMAVMAGSVGRGTFIPPVLVETGSGSRRPTPLDGTVVADLRSMMASVVSSGTATILRDTPGGPVRGKTGTAEYGSDPDTPPRVWFVGYQGDVAFAVLVEAGRSGATVAAPIAKDFLTILARG